MSWIEDAEEAEKRGLSYGKWMQIKPKQDICDPVKDPNARVCVVCGRMITKKDGFRRKTCSERCRTTWNNMLARRRRMTRIKEE